MLFKNKRTCSLPPLFEVAVVYREKDNAKSLANINPRTVVADTSSLRRTRARFARCFSRDGNASSEKIEKSSLTMLPKVCHSQHLLVSPFPQPKLGKMYHCP